jgi:uncharacterized membrane protein YeaQ/YmgE (transglycosylase-associated protein family)
MDFWSVVSALALGMFCGVVGRMLTPGDAFRSMSGPKSWAVSLGLGMVAALLGYWFFTGLLGIGDEDKFDWGGVIGALIFAVPVVAVASWIVGRMSRNKAPNPPTS